MFNCEVCGKSYTAKGSLGSHKKDNHPELFSIHCEICGRSFSEYAQLFTHITNNHGNTEKYFNTHLVNKIKCKYINCDNYLSYNNRFSGVYCCQQHYESQVKLNRGMTNLVKCEFCNSLFNDLKGLQHHFVQIHKFNKTQIQDYYDCNFKHEDEGKCLWCGEDVKFEGFTEGYKKFCYNKSCNVLWYNKNTDRLQSSINTVKTRYSNGEIFSPMQVKYWTLKGYSEEEAVDVISTRSVFSKEKCIKKYGEVEGLRIWKERQDKWQNTLKSKPDEEIIRINRAKVTHSFSQGYSKISQKMFWEIYNKLPVEILKDVNFATNNFGTYDDSDNFEYTIITKSKGVRLLDFYINGINKCIEFDGDYWHGKVGNVKRDQQRDLEIIETLQCEILHIKEQDYEQDKTATIEKCLNFLIGYNDELQ